MDNIRNEIKSYIAASGWTLVDIVAKMNESRSESEQTTPQNITNKLTRGTIKYSEVKEIAEIIGFKVVWEKTGIVGGVTHDKTYSRKVESRSDSRLLYVAFCIVDRLWRRKRTNQQRRVRGQFH